MRNRSTFIVSGAMLAGVLVGAWRGGMLGADKAMAQNAGSRDESISERLTALERAIIRNPDRPRETVLARLEVIEELLRKQEKAAQADETKKVLDAAAVEQERMERRLKILENKAQEAARNNINEMNESLRALKKDLANFQQTLKDLSDRVRRLEQRI